MVVNFSFASKGSGSPPSNIFMSQRRQVIRILDLPDPKRDFGSSAGPAAKGGPLVGDIKIQRGLLLVRYAVELGMTNPNVDL